jgi:hypothetical protein
MIPNGTTLKRGYWVRPRFNVLYRIAPKRIVSLAYESGDAGIQSLTETYYDVLETTNTNVPSEGAWSRANITGRVLWLPGVAWSVCFAVRSIPVRKP